jgi:hypothetical protein
MQAAEDGVSHNPARLWQRLRLARDALLDALVRAGVIEVGDVFLDDAMKMALAEDEEVVEAFSAETPQESLADGVGLWRPDWRPQDFDMRLLSDPVEGGPVLGVIVTNEESRRFPQWCSIAELLCDPWIGRIARNGEMHDATGLEFDDDKDEHGAKKGIVGLEEVAGPDLMGVVS